MVTLTMQRHTGEGEDVIVEVKDQDIKTALTQLSKSFDLMDERCANRNKMLLDAIRMSKTLPPEAQLALKQCVDILHGRTAIGDELARRLLEVEEEQRLKALETKNKLVEEQRKDAEYQAAEMYVMNRLESLEARLNAIDIPIEEL